MPDAASRLYVPEEWLREDFRRDTGFDAVALLDRLVQAVANFRMENPARADGAPDTVPMINLSNLKHASCRSSTRMSAGTRRSDFCTSRSRPATTRRDARPPCGGGRRNISVTRSTRLVGNLPGLASVTVHVQDIDRDRGYSTTAERKKNARRSLEAEFRRE